MCRRLLEILKKTLGFQSDLNNKERVGIQEEITENLAEIRKTVSGIENSGTYLIRSDKDSVISKIMKLQQEIDSYEKKKALKTDFAQEAKQTLKEYTELVLNYNQTFVQQRKKDFSYLWRKGKILLDDEQQTAIVTDDKHNLVVAAAGSGKTEVLITRIAYLTEREPDRIQPSRILAIAYQRKAKEQIEHRLSERYRIHDVNVRTFHKLGKDILEKSGMHFARSDIIDENKKYLFMKTFFEKEIAANPDFYRLFLRYIKTLHDTDEKATPAEEESVLLQAQETPYYSLNGFQVRSKAEKEIMDCLLTFKINGESIVVKYEPDVGGFTPDFHLPQYDVFLEHWAITKNGEVPKWFNQSTEEYRESMDFKKKWFAEHEKTLIETFAYEYDPKNPEEFADLLIERIKKKLEEKFPGKAFSFSSKTYEEIIDLVWESQKTPVEDIQNFITIAKTYGMRPDDVAQRMDAGGWTEKQIAFGKLALVVFREYQSALRNYEKIDFEDMINEASIALDTYPTLYEGVFDHILIDEYQDISEQRLGLLKRLMKKNPNCKLFCVGDDWQGIMGFSGANLDFFVNFGKYFENPAVSKICTNYRSCKSVVDAGQDLIRNNGKSQVQKLTSSINKESKSIVVFDSVYRVGFEDSYYVQTVLDCLKRISEYLDKGYSPDDVLVLTRYMRTKIKGRARFFPIVETFAAYSKLNNIRIAIDNAKEFNAVKLLTVHKCKGLEAKVVFVLNVVSGMFGFPSEIEDPAIFELARHDNGVRDQKEEERRLFYVAITRAKEELYIYTQKNSKSEFLEEIAKHTNEVSLTN